MVHLFAFPSAQQHRNLLRRLTSLITEIGGLEVWNCIFQQQKYIVQGKVNSIMSSDVLCSSIADI